MHVENLSQMLSPLINRDLDILSWWSDGGCLLNPTDFDEDEHRQLYMAFGYLIALDNETVDVKNLIAEVVKEVEGDDEIAVDPVDPVESDDWDVAKAKAETVKDNNIWMVLELDADITIDDLGMICVLELEECPGDFALHVHPHLQLVMNKMAGKDC